MSKIARPTPFFLRVYRTARIGVHLLEGVATTTFVFPLLHLRTQRALVRLWSRRLLRMLNVETRLHGAVCTDGNVLIVSNHVSWLDVLVLSSVHPVRFIAKAELARVPLIGRLLRDVGTLFVARARKRDIVALFPEGRTSDGTDVLPFKSALLQAIIDAKGRLQPVALRYCAASGAVSLLPAYVGDMTLVCSLWRITAARSLVVDMHARPTLAACDTHRRDLAVYAEAAIREALSTAVGATGPGTLSGREIAAQ